MFTFENNAGQISADSPVLESKIVGNRVVYKYSRITDTAYQMELLTFGLISTCRV